MSNSKEQIVIENYDQIKKWVNNGLYEYQMYDNLGIGKTTWEKYKKKLPKLLEILTKGNKNTSEHVSNSIYKMATGYNYIEQAAFKCKEIYYDAEGRKCEREVVKTAAVTKHMPAKTDAAKFWVINKDHRNWSLNPQEIERKKKEHKERMEIQKFNSF